MRRFSLLLIMVLTTAICAIAQDPVKVDSKHYRVEYEDSEIRVLRITFGPREKSVMHEHPIGGCVIRVTDENTKHTAPDGKITEDHGKAGTVECTPVKPGKELHNPENLSNQRLELIVIERKEG